MISNNIMNNRVKDTIATLNPNIEILSEYEGKDIPLHFKCKVCGSEWNKTYINVKRSLAHCPHCQAEHRKSMIRLSKEEIQNRLEATGNDMVLVGDYTDLETKTLFKCKKCGIEAYRVPSYVLRGYGCPKCAKYNTTGYATKGINDIATERPDLIKYFVNIEDAYKHRKMSSMKVLCRCPDCGNIKEQMISNLTQQGFSCPVCSDGVSYPNKFGRTFVNQLPVYNIYYEYSPEWVKPQRYDIYFEYKNKKYIIEMDGKWHKCDNELSGQTAKQSQEIDNYKDKLAKEHGINVIRIDCSNRRNDYIRHKIENSVLSNLFDLTRIDWEKCKNIASGNSYKDICEYYNSHNNKSISEISRDLNVCSYLVSRSLKKGNEFGWCHLDRDLIKQNSIEASRKAKYIPVDVYTLDNQLVHHFNSVIECSKKMTEIYGIKYRDQNISTSRGIPYQGFIFIKEREKNGEKIYPS